MRKTPTRKVPPNLGWEPAKLCSFNGHMLHGAGIFTIICPKHHPHVGKYTIHGAYGMDFNGKFRGKWGESMRKHGTYWWYPILRHLTLELGRLSKSPWNRFRDILGKIFATWRQDDCTPPLGGRKTNLKLVNIKDLQTQRGLRFWSLHIPTQLSTTLVPHHHNPQSLLPRNTSHWGAVAPHCASFAGDSAKLPKPFSPSPACQRSWRLDTETKQETEQPCLILIQKRCQDVLFFCPSVDQTSGPRLCKFVLGRPCHACCFILSCRSAGMRITSDCSYAFNFTTCIQRCNTPHQPSDIMLNPCSIK